MDIASHDAWPDAAGLFLQLRRDGWGVTVGPEYWATIFGRQSASPLGFDASQLDRDHDYGGRVDNQLRSFEHIGLFTKSLPAPPEELGRLADYRDSSQDLHWRARAYLHANCAHCHRKWGGGNAEFQLLATLDLSETGTAGVRPAQPVARRRRARGHPLGRRDRPRAVGVDRRGRHLDRHE